MLFALFALVLSPVAAEAQSAIAGQVLDNTGGLLPGTTVEAASPALIEGSRVVVTNGQGRYAIVGLEPGLYTVTFSLPGFGTFVREGIELPASFTASVDATLTVGALQETVTVSGAAPVVDVQQTQRVQVLSREVLDSIPTGRNIWSQAALIAGVAMAGTDVGGAQGVDDVALEAHGAGATQTQTFVDGLNVNTMGWNGMGNNWYSEQAYNDLSIQTSGGNAESMSGGVQVNMIPRDGGNIFSGTGYVGGAAGSWQSDNFSQGLKDQGLLSVNTIEKMWDYNGSIGGPIVREKLWFYHTSRYWGLHTPLADAFLDDGSPFSQHNRIFSPITRLTWQATTRNKITVHYDRQYPLVGQDLGDHSSSPLVLNSLGADPETARGFGPFDFYVAQAKWTSAASSRVLLELGYSASSTLVALDAPGGVVEEVGTPAWFSRTQKQDLLSGKTWGTYSPLSIHSYRHLINGAVSFVTGSHNAKVGLTSSWGKFDRNFGYGMNGHLNQLYLGDDPFGAVVFNYPVTQDPRVKYELGVYAQDAWTFDRVTVNGGVRIDFLNAYVGNQSAPAGRFVPARNFARIPSVPKWGPDVGPRFGISYDLFGNARTALKFSAGKYVNVFTTDHAQRFNPMGIAATLLPWSDWDILGADLPTNGDDITQDNELDFARLPTNFGERQLDRLDPDLKREYNVEVTVGVQHELVRGVSVSAGWYRRSYHRFTTDDNLFRDASDYRGVEVVSPYNGEVFTAFDLKDPAELALVDTFVTNATEGRREAYNGFEFSLQGRLPNGAVILTSVTTQRSIRSTCDEGRDDPNALRFCDRFDLPSQYNPVPFRNLFKFSVNYPLPGAVFVTGSFTSVPGRRNNDFLRIDEVLSLNWLVTPSTRYTEENCAGQPCTAGALVIPDMVLARLDLPLAPAGTERSLPRTNLLALGVTKSFALGPVTYRASADLFNVLNSNSVLNERSANFGTAVFGIPSQVVLGRLPRLSLQVNW